MEFSPFKFWIPHLILPVIPPVNSTWEPLEQIFLELKSGKFNKNTVEPFLLSFRIDNVTMIICEYLHASPVIRVHQAFMHLFSFIRMDKWEYAILPNKHEKRKA
jgi:hypothetical protein